MLVAAIVMANFSVKEKDETSPAERMGSLNTFILRVDRGEGFFASASVLVSQPLIVCRKAYSLKD